MTPWGRGSELRQRRLPPGPGTPREEARRNQRERLLGALVATVAAKGYRATTVADVVELSGVSRKAFYSLFGDKLDCFLAAMDEILGAAMAITASRLRRDGAVEDRAQRALGGFLGLVAGQPAATRLCLVESYAAGQEAVARIDAALAGYEALVAEALEQRPEQAGLPPEIARGMTGGLRQMIQMRLQRGAEAELVELGAPLVEFAMAFRPPPRPLPGAASRRSAAGRRARDGAAEAAEPRERIARATLAVVAERGYPGTRIADIAAAARVSLSTFYGAFESKEAALEAGLRSGRERMLAAGLPAYRGAASWPEGVRALSEAMLDHLAGEPEFARLIAVDVFAAGPQALEQLELAIGSMRRFLEEGVAKQAPQMPAVWREALISVLYAMLCERVREQGPERLPEMAPLATYVALSPFLGAEAACEVARGG